MAITMTRANLVSRLTRTTIAGKDLTRSLNLNSILETKSDAGQGGGIAGFFSRLVSFGKKFAGFLSAIITPLVNISAAAIYGVVVKTVSTLSTFDWAASDKEIQDKINGNNVALAGVWGSTLGSGVGWVSAIGIGYGITMFCPVIGSAKLAKIVSGQVGLEAAEEIGATTKNAIQATVSTMGTNFLLSGYRSIRKLFGYNPPDEAPSWTIAGQIEEKIDSIKDPAAKAFAEGFFDEFFDSFVEAGYIFAYELDSQLAAAKAAQSKGTERVVKLIPDKEAPKEAIIISAGEDELKTVVQTTLAQHRMIHNRDIGQIVGQPAEDWYRAKTQRSKLTIVFKSIEKSPFRDSDGKNAKEATYSIPDPKPGLSWEKIKHAAKAYNWGRFRATANLDNGRQMAVYGATPAEAEDKLQELMTLSTAEISTLSITEEKTRNPALKKDITRMYPATGVYLVRRSSVDATGRTDISGNKFKERLIRFPLWKEDEPDEFKELKGILTSDD